MLVYRRVIFFVLDLKAFKTPQPKMFHSKYRDHFASRMDVYICAMVKSRVLLGMVIPPLIGILIMGV